MEILPVLKNQGAIVAATTSPVVLDLSQWRGGYVSLKTTSDDDRLFILPLATSSIPGTVHVADTSGEGADHTNVVVDDVVDLVRGGPDGTHVFVKPSLPFLYLRTEAGTATVHVKPKGRPGEAN